MIKIKSLKIKIAPLFCLLLLCALPSCINDSEEDSPNIAELQIGDQLPDFQVIMNDDTRISKQDLYGHCSVIVFFHTQCPDCQKELPILQQLYDECSYPFKMVCISREESASAIQSYWNKHHLSLPYSAQDDATIYHLFASRLIPRIYISDNQCNIKAIHTDNPLATFNELLNEIKNTLKYQ